MSLWKSPWASQNGRTGPWLGSPWRSQRGRPIWLPSELFKNGEQGAWYDPSDLGTLFQDAAGTTPVTADGDPVGLMLDKSGNGNHASQSVSASRPIYRTDGVLHWLEVDGVDDSLVIPVATQGGATDNNFAASASLATRGFYVFGTSSDGGFLLLPGETGARSAVNVGGAKIVGATTGLYASGTALVSSAQSDITTGFIDLNLSTGYYDSLSFAPGPKSAPANAALFQRGGQVTTNNFGGKFYGLLLVNRLAATTERSQVEQYLASKSGVTL